MKKLLIGFGTLALIIGCSPKTVEVVTEIDHTADATMPKAAIGEGKIVFLESCGKCHGLKPIENFSKEQWAGILPGMIRQARLDHSKADQVTQYINWEISN